jgi:sugar phosphate isomerase/epimerase
MDVQGRSWLFCTVGFGHGEPFWRDYLSTLRLVCYDDVISIEHDDSLIERDEGFGKAARFLKELLIELPHGKLWFDEGTEALSWTEEMKR